MKTQTLAQRKVAIIKQCETGIWSVPEERWDEVMERIMSIQDEAGVDAWREWMEKEVEGNEKPEWLVQYEANHEAQIKAMAC